jgi:hypothetical protein
LIKISAFQGNIDPLGRSQALDKSSGSLKPLHAAKQLGRYSYFCFENLDKPTLA